MTVAHEVLTAPAASLVLLACGSPVATAALQDQLGPSLAAALGLAWAAPLDPAAPDGSLAALPAAALAPLPRDPGHPLADGRHWAEVLGAWRQPVLQLITPEQLQSGVAASTTALLQQWRVPLLGLIQAGGTWQPEQRRLEALPWLGVWAAEPEAALVLAIRRRWQQ